MVSSEKAVDAGKKAYTIHELLSKFKRHDSDSGSPEVQIIMLSYQVAYLTRHLNDFPKDIAAKRSLTIKVHQRRKTLNYLKEQDLSTCKNLVNMLSVRFVC